MQLPNRIYYLSSCNTCIRILKELKEIISLDTFELWDLKKALIEEYDLDWLYSQVDSYETLFNKRAQKFRISEIKNSVQSDVDYKSLILSDYTFLKRPVIIFDGDTFIGNSKSTINELIEKINRRK